MLALLANRYVLYLIGTGVLVATGGYMGYRFEHGSLVEYQAKVAAQAAAQAIEFQKLQDQMKESADEAKQANAQAMQSIGDYYRNHPPIRVRLATNGCSILSQAGSAKGINDTATLGYVSPYAPADTEDVAARLAALQALIKSTPGVIVQ